MKIKFFICAIVFGLVIFGVEPLILAGIAPIAPTAHTAPSAPVAPSPADGPAPPIAPSPVGPTAPIAPAAPQAPAAAPAVTAPSAAVPSIHTNVVARYGNTNSVYWITNAPYGNPVSGYTNTTYAPPMNQAK
jgi:hypothetical protein